MPDMAEPRVIVHFVGQMRRPVGVGDETTIPWQAGCRVDDVLAGLGYGRPERRLLRVLLDETMVGLRTEVPAGATLILFLPLGGG